MKKITKILCIFVMITFIIPQTGCTEKAEPISKEGYYLDTICNLTIYDMDEMSEDNALKVIDGAYKLCSEYEALLSKTRKGSDIYRINHADGEAVECSPKTIELLELALGYCEMSGGRFDVTIGKVTDLWDFHAEKPKVPNEEDISNALTAVNYGQIVIDGNKVRMENPEGEIDLGAIAKGYIADRVTEYLKNQGVKSAIVDLGGNICAVGEKKKDTAFRIGIKDPFSSDGNLIGSVPLKDGTMVTSGTYERSFEMDGKVYHHILDVETGYPVDSEISSVTIIGGEDESAKCDGFSTVCLILGIEEGKKLIESQDGFEAIFVDNDGKITKTSGIKDFKNE